MYEYQTLSTDFSTGVLTVTISNPPINVMTRELFQDLASFTDEVAKDKSVKVVVFESADPDFFIAHFDIALILTFPTDKPAVREAGLSDFHLMCQGLRTMPKATIVKMAGRAGGGGNEFCSACDMRFGIRGVTRMNQMEVPLGILPGGTGTQHLPRLIGRGRAMEMILGGDDLDAETAEKWGYLNRIFDSAELLNEFVDQLANRIALWPADAIGLAKASVLNSELPLDEGLKEEAYLFQQTLRLDEAQRNMKQSLVMGAQTREGELRINELVVEVAKETAKDKI
jgi:enoyl-CoA hydratase/carnithine racemase